MYTRVHDALPDNPLPGGSETGVARNTAIYSTWAQNGRGASPQDPSSRSVADQSPIGREGVAKESGRSQSIANNDVWGTPSLRPFVNSDVWATRVFQKSVGPAGGRNHCPTLLSQKSLGAAGGRFNSLFAPGDFGAQVPDRWRPAGRPSLMRVSLVHSSVLDECTLARPQ